MNHHDDLSTDIRQTLRTGAPAASADLRAACLPGAGRAAAHHGPSTPWVQRVALLAAAMLVLTTLAWLAMNGRDGRSDAASRLGAAIDAIDSIATLHVRGAVDRGSPDQPSEFFPAWEFWSVEDVGSRYECGGIAQIYDADQFMVSMIDLTGSRAQVARVEDRMIRTEMLARASAWENVVALRAMALRDDGLVDEQLVTEEGRLIRRLSGVDESGRDIQVDLDPDLDLVLRTEAWMAASASADGSVQSWERAVTEYEYPEASTFDLALFAPVPAGIGEVVTVTGSEVAKRQLAMDLRKLGMMVQMYAQEHDDAAPRTMADLAPYADRPIEEYEIFVHAELSSAIPVISRLGELPAKLSEVSNWAATVIFECTLGDTTVRCFVDGHVEM